MATADELRKQAEELRLKAAALVDEADDLEDRAKGGSGIVDRMMYSHSSKDSNWDTWEHELNQPENEAGRKFAYTLYEVGFYCKINLDTGECKAWAVEDRGEPVKLEREIDLN